MGPTSTPGLGIGVEDTGDDDFAGRKAELGSVVLVGSPVVADGFGVPVVADVGC